MSRTIPPLDLAWLLIETPDAPMHVGAVLLFERPARARATFVADVVRAWRAAVPVPPFDRIPDLVNVGLPRWVEAAEVDPEYHVQHLVLPPGTTERRFLRRVAVLHEPVLDRRRPGFRLWLIEGLPGRRFALYAKFHHSLVDGVSAMARTVASLARSPRARLRPPMFAVEFAPPRPPRSRGFLAAIAAFNRSAWRQTGALGEVAIDFARKALRRVLEEPVTGSQPFVAPDLPTNAPLRARRSFAVLSLSLAAMRDVGEAFGGTINDVAATVVDAALQRYLGWLGQAPAAPLVAMCPVSLREAGDTSASTKASAIFVPLGSPRAPIDERMEQVIAALSSGKAEMRALGKDAALLHAMSAFALAGAAELASAGRVSGRVANFVLSNVPGSKAPLYLAGARLAGIHPISALGGGIGLNVTLASHAGTMGFGIVANARALPEIERLARYAAEAFAALERAAPSRRGMPRPAGGGPAKGNRKSPAG